MASPKDDQFWFDESKKMVESGSANRNTAASLLQKTIGWLWGIYTGGAFIGLGLSETDYSLMSLIIIVIPSPILIIGYWWTVWAQTPLSVEFDPRIPDEIMEAYSKGSNIKTKRLMWASGISLFAAAMVSIALIVVSLERNTKVPIEQSKHDMLAPGNRLEDIHSGITDLSYLVSSLKKENEELLKVLKSHDLNSTSALEVHYSGINKHLDRHLGVISERITENSK